MNERELWFIACAIYGKKGLHACQGFKQSEDAVTWCEERRDAADVVFVKEVLFDNGCTYKEGTLWAFMSDCEEVADWESIARGAWARTPMEGPV